MNITSPLYRDGFSETGTSYYLLPFRFAKIDSCSYCLINELGDYYFVSLEELNDLVEKRLTSKDALYRELRTKHFIVDDTTQGLLDSYITKLRTKKIFITGFTKLHMIVPTLRCNHSCPYCQVSRVSVDKQRYDMNNETAKNTINMILRTPTPHITVEIQGGEPLLNFPIIQYIIEYLDDNKEKFNKHIEFVVCTNLSAISDDMLTFFKCHNVSISSSLDGPAFLHDANRPKEKRDSHALFCENLKRARDVLGPNGVAVLMTTTRESLSYAKEIIDEYLRLDFKSIFLRPLNPYGAAVKTGEHIGYTMEEFLIFYKKAFEYILALNMSGTDFQEVFAKMILTKILTPFNTSFVDCQSPSGAGIGAALYNYDGNVYPADEARMLAETGDYSFCLGNVNKNSFEEIFFGSVMQDIAAVSCNESLAGCSSCAFQPICGSDPINNYATQGYVLGHRFDNDRCKKHMEISKYLLSYLKQKNMAVMNVFSSWVSDGTVRHLEIARECQSS